MSQSVPEANADSVATNPIISSTEEKFFPLTMKYTSTCYVCKRKLFPGVSALGSTPAATGFWVFKCDPVINAGCKAPPPGRKLPLSRYRYQDAGFNSSSCSNSDSSYASDDSFIEKDDDGSGCSRESNSEGEEGEGDKSILQRAFELDAAQERAFTGSVSDSGSEEESESGDSEFNAQSNADSDKSHDTNSSTMVQ